MKWPEHYQEPHAEFYSQALHTLVLGLSRGLSKGFGGRLLCAWRVANITLVAMALLVLAWGILQVGDRTLPVEAAPPQLLTPSVPPGGSVKVRFVLVRYRTCAVDVSAVMYDGADEPHDLVATHRDVSGPLGRDHFTKSFAVPADARPGPARLRIAWAYTCPGNFAQVLSPILLAFPDIAFTITPR